MVTTGYLEADLMAVRPLCLLVLTLDVQVFVCLLALLHAVGKLEGNNRTPYSLF